MKCQRCQGKVKMVQVSAKCSDQYFQTNLHSGNSYDGYVPDWIGEYGDYVSFVACRHCGQIQGDWPNLNEKMNQFKSGKSHKYSS